MIDQWQVIQDSYINQSKEICISKGKYWIDPNHGSTLDAIEVHCVITSGRKKTCIEPTNQLINDEQNEVII